MMIRLRSFLLRVPFSTYLDWAPWKVRSLEMAYVYQFVFFYYNKIAEAGNFIKKRGFSSSQFWNFKSMVSASSEGLTEDGWMAS